MSQTLNSMSDNVRPRCALIVSRRARLYAADHYSLRAGAAAINGLMDPYDSGTGDVDFNAADTVDSAADLVSGNQRANTCRRSSVNKIAGCHCYIGRNLGY